MDKIFTFLKVRIISMNCSCTHIIDGIFLGGQCCANNREFIDMHKISVIFNVTKGVPFNYSVCPTCDIYRLPIDDNLRRQEIDRMYSSLIKYVPLLREYVNSDKRILVHCYAGIQRSATLIAGYLIKYYRMTPENAIEFIKRKRRIAFSPTPNFIDALTLYYKGRSTF